METISTNNLKQTPVPDPAINGASAPIYKKMERIDFLRKMYSYPPKVKISAPTTKSSSSNVVQPKILNFKENKPSIENFFHYYKTKKITSSFYTKQESFLKSNLQNVPVYVILNGNKEIVLAHHPLQDFFLNPTHRSFTNEVQNALSPTSFDSAAFNSNLGIFFFDPVDAEMHLANILKSDPKEAGRLGLSIHCVGLDAAYRLMHDYNPSIEFRFLPSLQEVSFFLENKLYNTKNLIDPNVQSGNQGYRTKLYKGVPIYIVRVKDKVVKKGLLQKPLTFSAQGVKALRLVPLRLWRSLTLQNTFFHSPFQTGELYIPSTQKNYKNIVFFKYNDAENFYNNNKQQIANLTRHNKSSFVSVFHKPNIYVTNLEDFLEKWQKNTFFYTAKNQPLGHLFNSKTTVFIPPTQASGVSIFPDRQISAKENFTENLKVKWNILVGVLTDFCSGK